jgi:hypothetical protein
VDITGLPLADGDRIQLTISAGLDAGSRPGWWVPEDLIPTPPPSPTPAPSVLASDGAPASSAEP